MRTQFTQQVQELIRQPWVERMLSNGQGEVYEHIATQVWERGDTFYGIQPGEHNYGQQRLRR